MAGKEAKSYDWCEIRKHHSTDDAWIVVHGKVYDITEFARRHPGGQVILRGAGHDGTILYESHHNLGNRAWADQALKALEIGTVKDYNDQGVSFDTPFAKDLLKACREALDVHGRAVNEGLKVAGGMMTVVSLLYTGLWNFGHTYFALPLAIMLGTMLASCHGGLGHAGSHGAVVRRGPFQWLNDFIAVGVMESYGMCLRHWSFSHVVSHHGYSYTDNDIMLETHLPERYWRVHEKQPWAPIHRFQGLLFKFRGAIAFLVAGFRFRVFPFCVFEIPVRMLLDTGLVPNPRFMPGGSTCKEEDLGPQHAGMGPKDFIQFDTMKDEMRTHFISNAVWMPLFFRLWSTSSFLWGGIVFWVMFGTQANKVIKSLLLQHVCEGAILEPARHTDWYKQQIEGSVDVFQSRWTQIMTFGVNLQCVHHVFPYLTGIECMAVRPAMEAVCKKHGVVYNYFDTFDQAEASGQRRMDKLAVEKKE